MEELGRLNYPQIAAVGMAASEGREPRIVELRWDPPAPAAAPAALSSPAPAAPAAAVVSSPSTATTDGSNEQPEQGSPIIEYPEVVIIGKGTLRDVTTNQHLSNPY